MIMRDQDYQKQPEGRPTAEVPNRLRDSPTNLNPPHHYLGLQIYIYMAEYSPKSQFRTRG